MKPRTFEQQTTLLESQRLSEQRSEQFGEQRSQIQKGKVNK